MKKSKFFRLFNTLSKKELTKFYRFAQLMYPKQEKQLRLLQYIKECKVDGRVTEGSLEKEEAYKVVFNGAVMNTATDRKNFSNLLSDLTKWLENFCFIENEPGPPYLRSFLIKEIYRSKNLHGDYFRAIKQIQVQNNKRPQDEWSSLINYIVNNLLYFKNEGGKYQNFSEHLLKGIEYLYEFYSIGLLKLKYELITREKILGEKHDLVTRKELELPKNENQIKSDILNIFQLQYHLGVSSASSDYFKFKKKIRSLTHVGKELHLSFLLAAINFCALQIRKGDISFFSEAYELYKLGLQKNLILIDGKITEMSFKNIVNLACKLKDFQWAKSFVETWSIYLPKETKNDLISLSTSRIYFASSDFEKALSVLHDNKYNNDFYESECRMLLAKNYYELKEFDRVVVICTNLEGFIRRKKSLNYDHKISALNFLQLLKALANGRKKKFLLKKINTKQYIFFKSWLVEKIEQSSF